MRDLIKVHVPPYRGSGKANIRWLKGKGDAIARGERLFDVDFEGLKVPIPSPASGTIESFAAAEGALVTGDQVVATVRVGLTKDASGREPMPICTSCGVIRGERAASCERCGAAHRAEALTIPTDSLDIWTSVTCTFKCRLCAFVVPLNAVHTEGQVVCPRCSLTQGFDVNAWSPALEFARDVGDGKSQGRHGGIVAHS